MRILARALDFALLGAIVLFFALGAVLSLSGCSSFLPAADRASLVANRAIAVVQHESTDARAAQLDACPDETCLNAGEAQWAPWLTSLEFLRQLAADFDDVLASAGRLGDTADVERIVIEAACDIAHAWDRLPAGFALLEPLHLSFQPPTLPPELDAVLHAGELFLCPAPADAPPGPQ